MRRTQVLGLLLLALPALAWAFAPRTALACWLAAWWWAMGVVLGCFVNAWMSVLAGGGWGEPVRATARLLARRVPWLLLGPAALAAAVPQLYPWASSDAWLHGIARPAFVHAWLSQPFFIARLAAYALAWWVLARPATLASKGRAAAALLAYTAVTSLAAIDIVMSLVPRWTSTGFGLLMLCTQALAGAGAVAFAMPGLARQPGAPRSRRQAGHDSVPISRDLGNLLLIWCMTWGYLAFMQFLIIWAENLPREIAWYLPRLRTQWQWAGLVLVLAQLVLPFLTLLQRNVKDRPARLRLVALLLLGATALDASWSIVPSVEAGDMNALWMQPLASLGMALLLLGGLGAQPGEPAQEPAHA
jgi:hypothetical protein